MVHTESLHGVSGDAVIGYIINHPAVWADIMFNPASAEGFVERHGVTREEAEGAAAQYLKDRHIPFTAANRAVEQAYLHLNGPRPSCPGGNCSRQLGSHDVVGLSFYIACNAMLAFAIFFFVQVGIVPKQWKTSVSIAGLVTIVAWYNYTYMKEQWISTFNSPTTYRYTDWIITVPLQIAEFYFILKASGPVSSSLGTRLFSTSVAMIVFGWLAEVGAMPHALGFILGCACWLYIVYEAFAGEAAAVASRMKSKASIEAFTALRMIVSVGWTIYPIGFAVAYFLGDTTITGPSEECLTILNILYNLADLINKGAFGLCVWSAAVGDKSGKEEALLG